MCGELSKSGACGAGSHLPDLRVVADRRIAIAANVISAMIFVARRSLICSAKKRLS
jgi:hypothetical protein